MINCRRSFVSVFLLVSLLGSCSLLGLGQSALSTSQLFDMVREVPVFGRTSISPDGTRVAYAVSKRSMAEKTRTGEILLQELNRDGSPKGAPIQITKAIVDAGGGLDAAVMTRFEWCLDGSCLTYRVPTRGTVISMTPEIAGSGRAVRYDISTGKHSAIESVAVKDTEAASSGRPAITTVPRNYQLSPSGRYAAFTSQVAKPVKDTREVIRVTPLLLRRGNYGSGTKMDFSTGGKEGLFVLDTATGDLRQLTPNDFNIPDFRWSPDGTEIAFTGFKGELDDPSACSTGNVNGLYAVNVTTKAVRTIVPRAGGGVKSAAYGTVSSMSNPLWSPDGKTIAFTGGDDTLFAVPAAGGKTVPLTGDAESSPDALAWSADSRILYFLDPYRMRSVLHQVDLATRKVTRFDDGDIGRGFWYSMSRDGGKVAFVVSEKVTTPPDLFVKDLATGATHRLTNLSPDFAFNKMIRKDTLHWTSRDGKTLVGGLLFTPVGALKTDGKTLAAAKPLPTITFITGGPNMVSDRSNSDDENRIVDWVNRGYAVFLPNTRPRPGYGKAFNTRGRVVGYGQLPYEDLMSGVDYLIKQGVADESRLAIGGHSFGGYITAYTITQTNRFRAALQYDGAFSDFITMAMNGADAKGGCLLLTAGGTQNPFDPSDQAKLIAQSPAFNMHKVKTPTMLLMALRASSANTDGRLLDSGLRRYKIPSEFIVFDGGHGVTDWSQELELWQRVGAWFDYWVRDIPYPEKDLQKGYDAWRATQGDRRYAVRGH